MRCTFWKMKPNGKLDGVFCHHGDNVAKLLLKHWGSNELVDDLISMGHLSRLGDHLNPTGPHTFQNPEPNCTVAYARDKGELKRLFKDYTPEQAAKCKLIYGKAYSWQPLTKSWHLGLSWKDPMLISLLPGNYGRRRRR